MRMILAIVGIILLCGITKGDAAEVNKLLFSHMSSASYITCTVWGGGVSLRKDYKGTFIQGAGYNTDYSRTLVLGTKTFATYSTVYSGKTLTHAYFTCRDSLDVLTSVRVYLNSSNTPYQVTDTGIIIIGNAP